jgi:hypothetical protein
MVITAKCAHCGAQIVFGEIDEVTICKYCDSVNAIPDVIKKSSTEDGVRTSSELREVLPELKYAANHQISSANSQGGHIWITKHELYFKPHSMNIGDLSKRYIRIQDICGYKKGMLTELIIYTKKGYTMRLAVWKKDEIINALETRRKTYYETRNMPVPELTKGDSISVSVKELNYNSTVEKAETLDDKKGMSLWQKVAIGIAILWFLGKIFS